MSLVILVTEHNELLSWEFVNSNVAKILSLSVHMTSTTGNKLTSIM
jgi:hypothetical protein